MTRPRVRHGPLHDEQGDWSFSRIALMVVLGFTLGLIGAAAFRGVVVPTDAWALLGGIITGLMTWAGGRAVARYLGPQVAAVVQGIAGRGQDPQPRDPGFQPHEWADGDPHQGVI